MGATVYMIMEGKPSSRILRLRKLEELFYEMLFLSLQIVTINSFYKNKTKQNKTLQLTIVFLKLPSNRIPKMSFLLTKNAIFC